MERIILVSNRLPVTVEKRKGELQYHQSAGGLATGLDSVYNKGNSLWIGWPGINHENVSSDEKKQIQEKLAQRNCVPVFLSRDNIDKYYDGFSNKTIWPLFHYFPQFADFDADCWNSYVNVNHKFAAIIMQNIRAGDTVWIHDYQLMLLPAILREKVADITTGFFLHIPFPSFEIFRLLPWRKQILEGLLGADLIGFHTFEYIRHFLNSSRRILGCDMSFTQITYQNRLIMADVFPMGIDYERFHNATNQPDVRKEELSIREKTGNTSLILSIDRLDYTKGVVQRLEAYDLLLTKYPQLKEKVTLILVEVPSRASVDSYRKLKRQIDELIGRINGKYGVIGWAPVLNMYRSIPFSTLVALYYTCDIALVTPLRDGMNLVAKEFVASKNNRPGVLILSEMAGAAREMGEALTVNPNNLDEMAEAIKTALQMSPEEQISRLKVMQNRLIRYNVKRWTSDFLMKLKQAGNQRIHIQAEKLSFSQRNELLSKAAKSRQILLLLDYDGTIVPILEHPDKAVPDSGILSVLQRLQNLKKFTVAIVSGRSKEFMEKYFGDTNLTLCAEHGVWIKEPQENWHTINFIQNTWKNKLKPILELYADRTPGAILEEKNYSLAFHFRNADPELATIRVRELTEALIHQVSNLNLCVMEGKKVIEIKNAGINKGNFALKQIEKGDYDLIIAIGDDVTDEDLFACLPEDAFSIKVGIGSSKAKYFLDSVYQVRELLNQISDLHTSDQLVERTG